MKNSTNAYAKFVEQMKDAKNFKEIQVIIAAVFNEAETKSDKTGEWRTAIIDIIDMVSRLSPETLGDGGADWYIRNALRFDISLKYLRCFNKTEKNELEGYLNDIKNWSIDKSKLEASFKKVRELSGKDFKQSKFLLEMAIHQGYASKEIVASAMQKAADAQSKNAIIALLRDYDLDNLIP